jgi:hypothetical protein
MRLKIKYRLPKIEKCRKLRSRFRNNLLLRIENYEMLKLCHECPNLNNRERGGNLKIELKYEYIRKYKERKILRKKDIDVWMEHILGKLGNNWK